MQVFHRLISILSLLLLLASAAAQKPQKPNSADIYDDIKGLSVLASAMYIAAHPDDENTRLIAYLSNQLRVHTTYLSLTRGDGGQNLIGPEIQELLGIIRTQELLAARRIDGGQQLFTRANDFGYSKNAEETIRIWNDQDVLADVVWAIRKMQPDIIINRFKHTNSGSTHGHHTASAMLSVEAFDKTSDASVFSDQLKFVEAWQPRRLFFNTSWWFYGGRDKFAEADKSRMLSVDVGVYYPLKGKSNTEIAAESRSMHRCQGFGATGSRGSMLEYMELLKGDMPADKSDLFAGINTTWSRLKGGAPIGTLLKMIEQAFDFEQPAASVPKLMEARTMIAALPDGHWKRVKLKEIESVISDCLGLYLEAVVTDHSASRGEKLSLNIEAVNRSDQKLVLETIRYLPLGQDSSIASVLTNNEALRFSKKIVIPANMPLTNPYWLNESWELGMYRVGDQLLRGLPETPRQLRVQFVLLIEGKRMTIEREVVFKKNDSVMGETYRPFDITPPVFANIADKVYLFPDSSSKSVGVIVTAGRDSLHGSLELNYPDGWHAEPKKIKFFASAKGQELRYRFELYPPSRQDEQWLRAVVEVEGQPYSEELVEIEYDHIPTQTVVRPAKSKIVKVDLKKMGRQIGYVMGAGDAIPASLKQIGFQVKLLENDELAAENLRQFDAVILGVRAMNTRERLKFEQAELMKYVEAGGTLIVQYNTRHRLVSQQLGPYPLKLSRKRVTVEDAPVRLLKPNHFVLNFPNKITLKDFEGWVQERGLYFPDEWDARYESILSSNDPGEEPLDGGLLLAPFGKGYFIHTSYSWFRQLPAGVPGAFRMFANLIAVGKRP